MKKLLLMFFISFVFIGNLQAKEKSFEIKNKVSISCFNSSFKSFVFVKTDYLVDSISLNNYDSVVFDEDLYLSYNYIFSSIFKSKISYLEIEDSKKLKTIKIFNKTPEKHNIEQIIVPYCNILKKPFD